MLLTTVAENVRQNLCEVPVTLNGQRAHIVGWKNTEFGCVVSNATGHFVTFSWIFVENKVTTNGGHFFS